MKEEREGLLKDIAKLKAALSQLAARHQGDPFFFELASFPKAVPLLLALTAYHQDPLSKREKFVC